MDCSVAVARLLTPVDDRSVREQVDQRSDNGVLLFEIVYDQSAASDVLSLRKSSRNASRDEDVRLASMLRDPNVHRRILVVLLRFAGVFTVTAFLAMFLPTDWMAATHRWLGLGVFPRAPVVDYLTRSIASLYGFHGVLLLLISKNPAHYRSIVRYVGVMNVLFGIFLVVIDFHAGMPQWWTLTEGPPIAAFGLVVLYLFRSL